MGTSDLYLSGNELRRRILPVALCILHDAGACKCRRKGQISLEGGGSDADRLARCSDPGGPEMTRSVIHSASSHSALAGCQGLYIMGTQSE